MSAVDLNQFRCKRALVMGVPSKLVSKHGADVEAALSDFEFEPRQCGKESAMSNCNCNLGIRDEFAGSPLRFTPEGFIMPPCPAHEATPDAPPGGWYVWGDGSAHDAPEPAADAPEP